jgi:hypothetical protein
MKTAWRTRQGCQAGETAQESEFGRLRRGSTMPTEDALLFIDANKYLDLYRTSTGRLILAAIRQQADYIFVTQTVVNEVQREPRDDGSHYYDYWLLALEQLCLSKGLTDALALNERRMAWAEAYRRTLHGRPVELPNL